MDCGDILGCTDLVGGAARDLGAALGFDARVTAITIEESGSATLVLNLKRTQKSLLPILPPGTFEGDVKDLFPPGAVLTCSDQVQPDKDFKRCDGVTLAEVVDLVHGPEPKQEPKQEQPSPRKRMRASP